MAGFGVLGDLTKALVNTVRDSIKLKSIRKEDLQQLLRENIEGHRKIEYALLVFNDKEMKDWFREKVQPALRNNKNNARNVIFEYQRALKGKAASEENKRPMGSLAKANHEYVKLLENISKEVDHLVEGEQVTIYEVRMSHVALLGILRQSDQVLNFSNYLYTFLSRVASRTAVAIPRYRDEYMIRNCDRVAKIVSLLLNKQGPYNFLQEVDTLRKNHSDLVLGATGTFNFLPSVNTRSFSISFLDNIASALSCLNIFSAALDAWDDYKLSKYERNKEDREWLENHVALLRMDMADTDPTSPEYQKLVAVIKAYDEKIADYDRKIIEFEQE